MADSHDTEKSTPVSFRDGIRELASANRMPLAMWCVVLLALLGYLGWAYYAEPEFLERTIFLLIEYVVLTALVLAIVIPYWSFKDKLADDLPLMDVTPVSPMPKQDGLMSDMIYPMGALITGFITFVASWLYCIATYGFLFGVGLGWLPSIIVAYIAGFLWPFILIGIVILVVLIFKG